MSLTPSNVVVIGSDLLWRLDWVERPRVWLKSAVLHFIKSHEDVLELVHDSFISPLEHSGSPSFGLLVLSNVCLDQSSCSLTSLVSFQSSVLSMNSNGVLSC